MTMGRRLRVAMASLCTGVARIVLRRLSRRARRMSLDGVLTSARAVLEMRSGKPALATA
jgi:hypothetical protein